MANKQLYLIIQRGDAEDLTDTVNEMISAGWKPQGGVAVTETSGWTDAISGERHYGETSLLQAIVKEDG